MIRNVFGELALLLACSALPAACGGDDDDDEFGAPGGSTQCAERSGAYRFKFSEQSGDCGPIDDLILVADGQSSSGEGCTGGQVPSASDSCLVSLDITCPGGQGTQVRQVGQVRWTADASSASGTVQLSLFDAAGSLLCQSIYDVTITR